MRRASSGGAQRGTVVVHLAVVGLPVHRGVGDGDVVHRQSRARRRRRPAVSVRCRQAPSPASAQQRLRAALHPGDGVEVDGVRAARRRTAAVSVGPTPPSKISTAGYRGRRSLSMTRPSTSPAPMSSPNSATCSNPATARRAWCTEHGRVDRDVSGSRSLRTTRYAMPWPSRVAASPPTAARRRSAAAPSPSRGSRRAGSAGPRRAPPTASTPAPASARRGSDPRPGCANGAPGTTQLRVGLVVPGVVLQPLRGLVPVLRAPPRTRRAVRACPVHASDVDRVRATSTSLVTATIGSRSGCANARAPPRGRHRSRAAAPVPAGAPDPSTSGSRTSGSSLCTLRSGAPPESRNTRTASANGEPSSPT